MKVCMMNGALSRLSVIVNPVTEKLLMILLK